MEELAALGLVQPASLQSISHSNKLEFADCPLQAQQEPVVGVLRVVDAVLIREDRPEDGAHLQEIVPIPVVAGDTAHLDAEDQADVLHGHLGQEALKSAPTVGPTTAQALIVVDDQDAIPRPAQGDRMVGEGILPLPRLAMIEDLLWLGLADVDDGEAIEMKIEDLGRSQDAGPAGQTGVRSSAELVGVRVDSSRALMIDLLPGGRSGQLLREDATERQEHPIAIGLREGFPELRERDRASGPSAGRGGLVGTRCVAWRPSVLRPFPAEPAPIGQLQERRDPDYRVPQRGSTRLYFRV